MEKIDFWEGLKEYNSTEVQVFIEKDFDERMKLFNEKDKSYGGSWQKDGLNGAFINLKRKWDRLEYIFKSGNLFEESIESVDDTLKDLENYAGMFFFLYKKKFEQYKKEELIVSSVKPIPSKRKFPPSPLPKALQPVNEEDDDEDEGYERPRYGNR